MSRQLLIVPKGTDLDRKDRERLSRAGFLVLELEHPQQARLLSPQGAELGASQLALAAVRAMTEAPYSSRDSIMGTFAKLVGEAMKAEFASREEKHGR